MFFRCTLGGGYPSTGSSGAGHGGNGGSGTNQARVGIAYGHVYEPAHYGCRGGGDGGGLGGGVIKITVQGTLNIDGLIRADGESGRKLHAGGGSGGSIWIKTNVIKGYGDVTVNGGHGFVDARYILLVVPKCFHIYICGKKFIDNLQIFFF